MTITQATLETQSIDADSHFVFVVPPELGKPIWDAMSKQLVEGAFADGPDRLIFELPDGEIYIGGKRLEQKTWETRTTFFPTDEGLLCPLPRDELLLSVDFGERPELAKAFEQMVQRNELAGFKAPNQTERLSIPKGYSLPTNQSLPTLLEARETATSISDGRDLQNWTPLEEFGAMLHTLPAKGAKFQIRLLPSAKFQEWHNDTSIDLLKQELQNCDFDSAFLFYACLSWALERPGMRVSTSLDALISAIGEDENARQGKRDELRLKIWRNLLVFDSLEVIGARPGIWKEPSAVGEKRPRMDENKLHSSDALLKILGARVTDANPPKDVVLVVGEWAAKFEGNREILSEFGNLRLIAGIPARQASGAWARCTGFGLLQHWREKSATAKPIVNKGIAGETRSQTLRFSPITRRKLLLSVLRPNHDVEAILNGNDAQRAKAYWDKAIAMLQEAGIIGFYKELKALPSGRWKEAWLDQPLDIRPKDEALRDALKINEAAAKARKKKPVTSKK